MQLIASRPSYLLCVIVAHTGTAKVTACTKARTTATGTLEQGEDRLVPLPQLWSYLKHPWLATASSEILGLAALGNKGRELASGLSAEEARLLGWHWGYLEYGCSARLHDVRILAHAPRVCICSPIQ